MTAPRLTAPRSAWIEIDLDALVNNARVLRQAIPAGARLGILVKANGYGHGLEASARAALAGGAGQLIVATLEEGLALRAAGLDAPILVAYPIPVDQLSRAVEAGLELSVSGLSSTRYTLNAWRAVAGERPDLTLPLHVEVDTGMGRGGVVPASLGDAVEIIDGTPATRIVSIWSHLADGSNAESTDEQVQRYETALAAVAETGRPRPLRHISASEAVFTETAPAFDMVRVGLAFYGHLGLDVTPAPELADLARQLRPAMTVKARPVRLEQLAAGASVGYGREWFADRPSLIATLPIGYADGWARAYWPGAFALVRGRRVPLVGRVSMDSVCADVTDHPQVADLAMDDDYVLLGRQADESITVDELSRLRHTIPNEVLCSFGARLPRVHVGAGALNG